MARSKKPGEPRKKSPGSGSNITKGMRPGGRAKNTPNKRTTEAAERARIDVENAKGAGKKLGKEVLEDYMGAFHSIAALFQNRIVKAAKETGLPAAEDLKAFAEWGGLVIKAAKDLADFQSPKFRAIMVSAPADQHQPAQLTQDGDNVYKLNDAVALARVYTNMVKRVG